MDAEFWHQRWQKLEIGFHLSEVNPMLVAHWPRLNLAGSGRVFVPLCGKSLDMVWLLEQGYEVVGVELSPVAVEQLFEGLGVSPETEQFGQLTRWQSHGLTVWCGDLFSLTDERLGAVDAVYDRAALIALPTAMREQYVAHLQGLVAAKPRLLITLEYEQSRVAGPPFSVMADEVQRHFGSVFEVSELERITSDDIPPKFRQAGLTTLDEVVYRLEPC